MFTKKIFITAFFLFFYLLGFSQERNLADYQVIPLPQEINISATNRMFSLSEKTKIVYPKGNEAMKRNARFLADYIKLTTGIDLKTTFKQACRNAIVLSSTLNDSNREAYKINVNRKTITINGASEAGVFYGIQTLRKSLPTVANNKKILFPTAEIYDYPRFEYRGMHLDVGRHFFPAAFIKKYLDILSLHNINRFHWHLTEDMGWRIEIKKYPKLTEIGSIRKETEISCKYTFDGIPYGGFYTQDEVREIVKYAAERHIAVIPEIDLPGHILSALASYPELGCTGGPYEVARTWGIYEDVLCVGKESTFEFLENVFLELMELFPSKYIHIGGDECPKTRWEKCPHCQERIRELGELDTTKFAAENYLHSYAMERVEKFLNKHGRQVIGWDEILEGKPAPNATVMSWRGMEGGIAAAKAGHNVVMTPYQHAYFDYYQSRDIENEPCAAGFLLIDQVYNWDPVPEALTSEEEKHIIGAQANLWTEHVIDGPHVEYMAMPRIAAMAEVQWTVQEKRDYADFLERVPQLTDHYDINKYNYATTVFDINFEAEPDYENSIIRLGMNSLGEQTILYTTDGAEPSEKSTRYTESLKLKSDADIKALVMKNGRKSKIFEKKIRFSKATAKRAKLLTTAAPTYDFSGKKLLTDGVIGSNMNFKSGEWIGFQDQDFVAVIDLNKPTAISSAEINTLISTNDWIFNIGEFTVESSTNGTDFSPVAQETYQVVPADTPNQIKTIQLNFKPVTARFFKITLKPVIVPDWHPAKGIRGFFFIDEVKLTAPTPI